MSTPRLISSGIQKLFMAWRYQSLTHSYFILLKSFRFVVFPPIIRRSSTSVSPKLNSGFFFNWLIQTLPSRKSATNKQKPPGRAKRRPSRSNHDQEGGARRVHQATCLQAAGAQCPPSEFHHVGAGCGAHQASSAAKRGLSERLGIAPSPISQVEPGDWAPHPGCRRLSKAQRSNMPDTSVPSSTYDEHTSHSSTSRLFDRT